MHRIWILCLKTIKKSQIFLKKTKDESAGNLIVYTRDDLERMQVESLKDILKSLRGFTYLENRFGQPDILNADPITYYSKSVRIYLNENELLTSLSGSGFIIFGDMEMDFIDHVEIYEGFPSFDIGVEPATIVIRLYTKSPKHDEGGGRVKAMLGSHGTNKENVYYTNKEGGVSYFVYANNTDSKQDSYKKDAETLRRDKQTKRFYGSIANEQHKLEVHAVKEYGDAFIGSFIGNIPDNTSIDTDIVNINLNSKFMNESLKVSLSYIDSQSTYMYQYDQATPVLIPIATAPFFTPIRSLDRTIREESFTGSVKKEWNIDAHEISAGMQLRYKHFDLTDVKFDVPINPVAQAYSRENIYSIFLQDLVSFSDEHMISLSVMSQMYDRDGNVDNPHTLQLRFGYIYTNGQWVAKTFISRQEFASEPYMTISPYYGNPNLESEIYESIFQEISYAYNQSLWKVVLGYGTNKKTPILDDTFTIENSKREIIGKSAALEFTYLFSKNDKLELQTNYTYLQSPYGYSSIQHYHNTIRMLNTVSKFDIFNELTTHGGYSDVPAGYDYSFGVKYAFTKDLHINIKGENIFNKGLKNSYLSKTLPQESVVVPVLERRFLFAMECLF